MREIGAFEAKNKLSELLDQVENGAEIVITRRGRAVAKLVPAKSGFNKEKARQAVVRLRQRAATLKSGRFNWDESKQYRDEGRR